MQFHRLESLLATLMAAGTRKNTCFHGIFHTSTIVPPLAAPWSKWPIGVGTVSTGSQVAFLLPPPPLATACPLTSQDDVVLSIGNPCVSCLGIVPMDVDRFCLFWTNGSYWILLSCSIETFKIRETHLNPAWQWKILKIPHKLIRTIQKCPKISWHKSEVLRNGNGKSASCTAERHASDHL